MAKTTAVALSPATDPEVRKTGIGGSDSAAVLGVSRWQSRLGLWQEKRGEGNIEDEHSVAMEWGNILEPLILEQYARRSAQVVTGRLLDGRIVSWAPNGQLLPTSPYDAVELLSTLRHPSHPHMMCHLDGVATNLVTDEVVEIIEAKSSLSKWIPTDTWGEDGTDEVPPDVICQTAHNGLIVSEIVGRPVPVVVPVLQAGPRWAVYRIRIDFEFWRSLEEQEAIFWKDVLEGNMPPPEPTERDKRALAALFPRHDDVDDVLVAPDEPLHQVAIQLATAKTAEKDAKAEKIGFENVIKQVMQATPRLIGPGWKATWKTSKARVSTDWKGCFQQLAEQMNADPELVEKIEALNMRTGAAPRSFRFTPGKDLI